jgi:hypothetical protein
VYVVQFAHLHVLTFSVPSCDVLHDFRFSVCLGTYHTGHIEMFRPLIYSYYFIQWNYTSSRENWLSYYLTSHTDNPSGTRAFTLDIQWDSCWLVFFVVSCRSLFHCLSFSFWSLYCLHCIGVCMTSDYPLVFPNFHKLLQLISSRCSFSIVLIYNLLQLIFSRCSFSIVLGTTWRD